LPVWIYAPEKISEITRETTHQTVCFRPAKQPLQSDFWVTQKGISEQLGMDGF